MSQLNKTRGEGSSADWKPKLRRKIGIIDFFVLLLVTVVNLRIRFPQIWIDDLTNYEIKNIGIATVIIFSWLVVLWFNGSRDTNILGFGADEYKRLINATLFSFTFIAFVSYIFKLEISRGFVLLIFPTGLISLFISRRIFPLCVLCAKLCGRADGRPPMLQISLYRDICKCALFTIYRTIFANRSFLIWGSIPKDICNGRGPLSFVFYD